MGKITKIQAQKRKGRYNIFVDGKYSFAVSETVLANFRLFKDTELTDEQITEISKNEQSHKYYIKALNYLSHQMRSEKEIKDYLNEKDAEMEDIQEVIQRLKAEGYLNDADYAQSFINTHVNTTLDGPIVIKNKLHQKGIDKELADEKILNVDYSLWLENADKQAQKIIRRSQRYSHRQLLNKVKSGLLQKGYTSELLSEVVAGLDIEENEDLENENLQRDFEKAVQHYKNKDNYKNKIYQSLMRKGYASSAISELLNK